MDHSSAILKTAVLGGDMRQNYLADYLSREGHIVSCFRTPPFSGLHSAVRHAASLKEVLSEHTVIIGPVPFTKNQETVDSNTIEPILLTELYSLLKKHHFLAGGNLPPSVFSFCNEQKIPCYDYMKSTSLAYHNAEITAEGMLCELIKNTPFAIQNKPILVIGYGKCGSILAHKLYALGCRVSVCELDREKRELASSFGFHSFPPANLNRFLSRFMVIINTVPSLILGKESFSLLPSSCFLFDLSSLPGGIDHEAAKVAGLPVFHCPGLPGKTAPQSAGEAIAKNILERISEYD